MLAGAGVLAVLLRFLLARAFRAFKGFQGFQGRLGLSGLLALLALLVNYNCVDNYRNWLIAYWDNYVI